MSDRVETTPWWRSATSMPAVGSPLWRLVACARPPRIGSDTWSLIKVGLVGEDAAGASTDRIYPYDVAYGTLARPVYIPLTSEVKTAPYQCLAVALIVIWALLCSPLHTVERTSANRMSLEHSLTELYLFLAVPYLYAMFAIWAMLVVTDNLIGVRSLSARDLF